MKKIVIAGAGISGLSAAAHLAKEGHDVTVYEKLPFTGGRASVLEDSGFRFDKGPTFYWMPDIFNDFFSHFGKKPSDYYSLRRLDPGYEIYFGPGDSVKMPADINQIYETFNREEPGSGEILRKFLKQAEFNYRIAIDKVMEKPGDSPLELVMFETASNVSEFLSSISNHVKRKIKSPKLRQILEFPVIFLGAKPSDTPLFYRFMNYADMVLGTWHIEGGFGKLSDALYTLAKENGAKIITCSEVTTIKTSDNKVTGVEIRDKNNNILINHECDFFITSADYHFSETLLEKRYRNYSENYWQKKVFAPSALLFYVGFGKKIKNVSHHTLFFDTSFKKHAETIYDTHTWPEDPLFYASFPSVTDPSMAPEGKECGIFLIPLSSGLKEDASLHKKYFREIINRMEKLTGQELTSTIEVMHSYGVKDFVKDYHSYKGNAYGLSNILTQTAFLKPKMRNRKLPNMLYCGQLTVPGPGVPPSLISGKIAARLADKYLKNG